MNTNLTDIIRLVVRLNFFENMFVNCCGRKDMCDKCHNEDDSWELDILSRGTGTSYRSMYSVLRYNSRVITE